MLYVESWQGGQFLQLFHSLLETGMGNHASSLFFCAAARAVLDITLMVQNETNHSPGYAPCLSTAPSQKKRATDKKTRPS
jgi:hypothetical protein